MKLVIGSGRGRRQSGGAAFASNGPGLAEIRHAAQWLGRSAAHRVEVVIPATASSSASGWRIWQLVDSGFPAGAMAHSGGLEAAWQSGCVRSPATVGAFVVESIEQAAHGALPFVRQAMQAGADLSGVDVHWDTFVVNHVANRASRLQGRAFLTTVEEVFGMSELAELRRQVMSGERPGHLAVMFGAVMRMLEVDETTALRMYLFMGVRGVLSAAVRLALLGPLEAQRLQISLDPHLEAALAVAGQMTPEDACQTSPLQELWQMGQDRLYSRLFQS